MTVINSKKSPYKNRNDLTLEFPFWDQIQIIIFISFSSIWICDTFIFHYSTFLAKYVSLSIRIPIFTILFFLAGYLAKTGLKIVFKEVRTPPEVIEKSVFGIVRHPVYLASLLTYFGLTISSLSIICFIYFIVICIVHNYAATYEEKKLIEKFGEKYISYMEKVPKWLPIK